MGDRRIELIQENTLTRKLYEYYGTKKLCNRDWFLRQLETTALSAVE